MKNYFKKLISTILFTALVFANMSFAAFANEGTVYVSKTGSDVSGNGTSENPYRTIEKAKEAVKASSAFLVTIKEGVYTVSDLSFDSSDSGVTYKGEGNVVITEAKNFSVSEFNVVKNPDILKRLRPETWGKVYELGLEHYNTDISEIMLFIDGKKQNISRYPNMAESQAAGNTAENPYMTAINPATNADETDARKIYDNTFSVSDERVSKWGNISDAYIIGSVGGSYDWRKRTVNSISDSGEITASDYVRDKAELYICNLVEEIDVPGEYAYNSTDKMLYVYMPENAKTASVVFKGTNAPLITVNNCSDLTFENIKFDKLSKQIFKTRNSDGLNIKNCEFNYITADYPLEINGKNINIDSNKAYGNSGGFVKFSGGEVTAEGFLDGNIAIKNNIISNCGNDNSGLRYVITCGTNAPEYKTDSIGSSVENNVIYNCGGVGAIGVAGNNLIVKNNEIFNVVRHIHDGGAIYLGKSNVKVGNEISNNYIHDLNKNLTYMGIYSDDGQGGITVKNNVVANANYGMQISAGMQGEYLDNKFVDNKTAGMIYSTRMNWTSSGVFAQPGASIDENGYAKNQYGDKIFTLYGETKKALEEYPKAYSQYSWLKDSLERRPFFAPWNTKINGNIHYTNSTAAKLSYPEGFYHTYLKSDGTPVVEYEDQWLKESGRSEALSDGKINEIALYGGEMNGNEKKAYSGNVLETLSEINSVGITDTSLYSNDFSFDFTPVYSDGKLKVVLDKSKNLSKYNISLIQNDTALKTAEYFDNNGDTAYETKDVTPGETYNIKIDGYGLAKQNSGSYTLTKTFTVPEENDKTALSYAVKLLQKEYDKAKSNVYVYENENVVFEMEAALNAANEVIGNSEAGADDISSTKENVLNVLSNAQAIRSITQATISSCSLSETETRVTVAAEDFEPYSYVTIAVTNPKYVKEDIKNNSADDVIRYVDVKRTGYSGEVEFVFDTAVNGIDMPDYYNIYLVDANGREVNATYYYGTIETSAVSFTLKGEEISKEDFVNKKGETLKASLNVNNRMKDDIDAVVYCGIYDNNKLINLAMAENSQLKKNTVNEIAFDIKIPENYTENSKVEIMIFDKETLIKPLTVKKTITEVK